MVKDPRVLQNPLRFSMSTLIEVSSLLGHELEDRTLIRRQQDDVLIRRLQEATSVKVREAWTVPRFFFGCIDFLVYDDGKNKRFQPIEMNGTNMVGVTNIPLFVLEAMLYEMAGVAKHLNADPNPVILVPYSGTQTFKTSGNSQLIYERILYAQSIKEAFQKSHGHGIITPLPELLKKQTFEATQPTVVLGFLKDLLNHISLENGRVQLLGQPVSACLHDMFCDFILQRYPNQIDLGRFCMVNHIFPVTTDKGGAYRYFNDLLQHHKYSCFKNPIVFTQAETREALIGNVLSLLSQGKKLVIKPHAAGLGRGIEFFLRQESPEEVTAKIDSSIQATERYYGVEGGIFPYTVCEFIDSSLIQKAGHPFDHHKYELRIFVYREDDWIRAAPSIAKVASQRFDEKNADRLMLLNNIAAAKRDDTMKGTDFMLPLANPATLDLLGLTPEHLAELCQISTDFVRLVVTETEPLFSHGPPASVSPAG